MPFEISKQTVEEFPLQAEIIEGAISEKNEDNIGNKITNEVDTLNSIEIVDLEKGVLGQGAKSTKFGHKCLDSDHKFKFFTGIPSIGCFQWLFNSFSSELPDFDAVLPEDAFFIVFIKLRLDLLHQDLAY